MLTADVVRAMLDYNYAFQRRLWDSIMTLTDDQFTTDIPYSHGSIRNHMVHLASVDGGWLRGLQEDPNARAYRFDPAQYATRERVRAICEQSASEVTAYAAPLNDAALMVQPKGLPLTVWQTLLHLVNHGTDHRAQVLRALHDFGAPTFDQDYVYHVMGR
ncbi:MAG: DinB family protein [Anaerolineaceae bacterium]|nr:DinB family protein [Anaerolineaceae bacterium]